VNWLTLPIIRPTAESAVCGKHEKIMLTNKKAHTGRAGPGAFFYGFHQLST
jgi:hypothetical protein